MSILTQISRFGSAMGKARRNRYAISEMNALPWELQKDIGWPASPRAKSSSLIRAAYLNSLR